MTDRTSPPGYIGTATLPFDQDKNMHHIAAGQNVRLTAMFCNGSGDQNCPLVGNQGGYSLSRYAYPHSSTIYESYLSNTSRTLGIIQIILGSLCIVCNIVGVVFRSLFTFIGIGIWGGIVFIISGAFGISAGKLKTNCKITSSMVLSIISATITVFLFIYSVLGALNDDNYIKESWNYNNLMVGIAMNSLLAILAVAEAIPAIWAAVLGFKVYRCCSSSDKQKQVMAELFSGMHGSQPLIVIPLSHLNFGEQLTAYRPGYADHQTVQDSAPPYPYNYGLNRVPLVPQVNNSINQNEEKSTLSFKKMYGEDMLRNEALTNVL